VIALLDTLDKDINTFIMRVREWYGWHFPELVKIVNDNYQYARIALIVGQKSSIIEDPESFVAKIQEVTLDEVKAKEVVEAAKTSMGQVRSPCAPPPEGHQRPVCAVCAAGFPVPGVPALYG
jgi:nucleolar protein 56